MSARSVSLLGCLAVAAGLSACAAVFGFDELVDLEADATAPQLDASELDAAEADAGPAAQLACRAYLPDPPDSAQAINRDYHFAIASLGVRLGNTDAGQSGLDLDCNDTRQPSDNGCRSSGSELQAQFLIDGPNGVDNAAIGLFTAIRLERDVDVSVVMPLLSRAGVVGGIFNLVSSAPLDGDPTAINDGQIVTVFEPARGLLQGDGGCDFWRPEPRPLPSDAGGVDAADGSPLDAGNPATIRPLQASDKWCIDNAHALGKLTANASWITGGTFVAQFPEILIPIAFSTDIASVSYARIESAYVTATIVHRADGLLGLAGTIAGRWNIADMAKQFAANVGRDAGDTRCDLAPAAQDFLAKLCGARDITRGFDLPAEPVACDSLSFGMDFEAYEVASHGVVTTFPSAVEACLAGGAAPDSGFFFDCP